MDTIEHPSRTPDRDRERRGPSGTLEAWFAAAGITATVVAACPEPKCPLCRPGAVRAA